MNTCLLTIDHDRKVQYWCMLLQSLRRLKSWHELAVFIIMLMNQFWWFWLLLNIWKGRFSRAPPCIFRHTFLSTKLSNLSLKFCFVFACISFVCVCVCVIGLSVFVPFWTWSLLFGLILFLCSDPCLDLFVFWSEPPCLNSACLSLFTAWIDSSYYDHCLTMVLFDYFPRLYFPVLSYVVYASFFYLHIIYPKQNPFSLNVNVRFICTFPRPRPTKVLYSKKKKHRFTD